MNLVSGNQQMFRMCALQHSQRSAIATVIAHDQTTHARLPFDVNVNCMF